MKRENRYAVIKHSDIFKYLSDERKNQLEEILTLIEMAREFEGRKPLQAVVVEHDWPEYEPTWKAIEARVTGNNPPTPPEPPKKRIVKESML